LESKKIMDFMLMHDGLSQSNSIIPSSLLSLLSFQGFHSMRYRESCWTAIRHDICQAPSLWRISGYIGETPFDQRLTDSFSRSRESAIVWSMIRPVSQQEHEQQQIWMNIITKTSIRDRISDRRVMKGIREIVI
jgi:hypothetical protein